MWSEVTPFAGPVSAVSVMSLVTWLVLKGRLIALSTHQAIVASKQEVIDSKKEEIASLREALSRAERQRDELMGLHHVAVAAVQAIPAAKDAVS